MNQIIPAILVHSEEQFRTQINSIKDHTNLVQLDIADGIFVDNKTWADPNVIQQFTEITFELHLMVSHPLEEIDRWKNTPNIHRFLFHLECADPIADVIVKIKEQHREVGLVINPETSLEALEPYINNLDEVQFMTIHPGKQGQPFLPEVLKKIQAFRNKHPQLPIGVDGHIDETTIPQVLSAGATRLGIGSAIFGNEKTPTENIRTLKQLIHG